MPYKADNITQLQETQINRYLIKLQSFKSSNMITASECQYLFLKYLESMDLGKTEVFNVFTNSTI